LFTFLVHGIDKIGIGLFATCHHFFPIESLLDEDTVSLSKSLPAVFLNLSVSKEGLLVSEDLLVLLQKGLLLLSDDVVLVVEALILINHHLLLGHLV